MANESLPTFFTPEFKRNLRQLAKKYPHIRADVQPIIDAIAGDNGGFRDRRPGRQRRGTVIHASRPELRLRNSVKGHNHAVAIQDDQH